MKWRYKSGDKMKAEIRVENEKSHRSVATS